MTSTNEIIFVAGKDPTGAEGGHANFVKAHARAAVAGGWRADLFCVGHDEDIVETSYGRLHRIRSPFSWLHHRRLGQMRSPWAPFHVPLIERRIRAHLRHRVGRFVVHGFGIYGAVGARLRRRQSPGEAQIVAIASEYHTLKHEFDAKRRGTTREHGPRAWINAQWEYYWMKVAATRLERQALEHSDLVAVNYDSVTRLLRDTGPLPTNLLKLPYTSEEAFLDPHGAPDGTPEGLGRLQSVDAPLILAMSRHDPRKGLDVLLRALAGLRGRGVPLRACLLGGEGLLDAHRRLARKLELDAVVVLTGHVPDPRPYISAADVFVLPSLEEASGSVALIEALRGGLAVVASNVDGIPEDVTDRDSALLVPPGDVSALGAALRTVIEDTELRERLQRRARAVFDARFSPQVLTDCLSSIYRRLLSDDGRAQAPNSSPLAGA